MCRIFGFKSILESKVHSSLVSAKNAFTLQSETHSDGWGLSYYIDNFPHTIKSIDPAIEDSLFYKVTGVVQSKLLIAHLRKATIGSKNLLNSHPFQYQNWSFLHNGNLVGFEAKKDQVKRDIDEKFSKYILGKTDSEMIFYHILTNIYKQSAAKAGKNLSSTSLIKGIRKTIRRLNEIFGPIDWDKEESSDGNFLTFLLTDGDFLIAYNGGKSLFYSTYKHSCPIASQCEFHHHSCENEVQSGTIRHLVISSEKIGEENIWEKLKQNEFVMVDKAMNFKLESLL